MIDRSKDKSTLERSFSHAGFKEPLPAQSGTNDNESEYNLQDKDALYFLTLILLMLVTFFLFKTDFLTLLYSSAV